MFQISKHMLQISKHMFQISKHMFQISNHMLQVPKHMSKIPKHIFQIPKHMLEISKHMFQISKSMAQISKLVFQNIWRVPLSSFLAVARHSLLVLTESTNHAYALGAHESHTLACHYHMKCALAFFSRGPCATSAPTPLGSRKTTAPSGRMLLSRFPLRKSFS